MHNLCIKAYVLGLLFQAFYYDFYLLEYNENDLF